MRGKGTDLRLAALAAGFDGVAVSADDHAAAAFLAFGQVTRRRCPRPIRSAWRGVLGRLPVLVDDPGFGFGPGGDERIQRLDVFRLADFPAVVPTGIGENQRGDRDQRSGVPVVGTR